MRMTTTDWILLLVLSCLWGTSYFLIEIGLQGLPVPTLVALRISLAAAVLWLFVLMSGVLSDAHAADGVSEIGGLGIHV